MYFDREKYKQFSRQQIAGRRKNASLAVLIVVLITFLFSIPETRMSYSFEEMYSALCSSFSDFINYINSNDQVTPLKTCFSIIETLISFILSIVIASFFLIYSRSPEPVSLKAFFAGFNKWGRGILTGLWQVLWYFVWIALIVLAATIIFVPVFLILSVDTAGTVSSFLTLLLTIAAFILIIIKGIEYSHHYYIVAEFPEIGIRKALRISILITKDHRMDIFVTHLTFLGYYLLGMLTIGFAQIWYRPYTEMTFINIYHALLKDALEKGKIHPEDLN